jgi:putative ABC transport system permease protein
VLTPAAVLALGLDSAPHAVVAATSRMPTQAERDRFEAAVNAAGNWNREIATPAEHRNDKAILILTIAAGLITLGAAAIATGLAAADGKADLATLAAVGASPTVRRLLSLSQTGIIAGLGSVLGVAAGVAAALAVVVGTNRFQADIWPAPPDLPLDLPWRNLLLSLLVVPAVAMLGAGLLTRGRLPIERRL